MCCTYFVFVFCLYVCLVCCFLITGTILLPGFLVLHNTAVGTIFLWGTWNHHCLLRVPGLGARLLPDQFLFLSSSHYCWGTGSGAKLIPVQLFHNGVAHNCCRPYKFFWPGNSVGAHAKSGWEPRGPSVRMHWGFPAVVPSVRAALMGMVYYIRKILIIQKVI